MKSRSPAVIFSIINKREIYSRIHPAEGITMWEIIDKETREIIEDGFLTEEKAEAAVEEYKEMDKDLGVDTPDFYVVHLSFHPEEEDEIIL